MSLPAYIRLEDRIIVTTNVVEVKIYPPGKEWSPGFGQPDPHPDLMTLEIVTTAPDWAYNEYANEHIGTPAYTILLQGDEAVQFLEQFASAPEGWG